VTNECRSLYNSLCHPDNCQPRGDCFFFTDLHGAIVSVRPTGDSLPFLPDDCPYPPRLASHSHLRRSGLSPGSCSFLDVTPYSRPASVALVKAEATVRTCLVRHPFLGPVPLVPRLTRKQHPLFADPPPSPFTLLPPLISIPIAVNFPTELSGFFDSPPQEVPPTKAE